MSLFNNAILNRQTSFQKIASEFKADAIADIEKNVKEMVSVHKDTNDSIVDRSHIASEKDRLIFEVSHSKLLDDIVEANHVQRIPKPFGSLYNEVTSNKSLVYIKGKMPLSEIIEMANSLYETLPDTFYGVLVKHGKHKFYNPLHPLIANAMVEGGEDMNLEHEAVFFTSSKTQKSDKDIINEEKENIVNIITSMSIPTSNQIHKVTNISTRLNDSLMIVDFDAYDKKGNLVVKENDAKFIVPNQIINSTIIAPYYGISCINRTGTTLTGAALTKDMRSANISSSHMWSAVCTGGKGHDKSGIRTLSHSNHKSPMSNTVLTENTWNLVRASIETSLMIYGYTYELNIKEPIKRIAFDEWKALSEDNIEIVDYMNMLSEIKSQEIS